MAIDSDRIRHIMSVAEKMRRIVASKPADYSITPDEAFLIGYLHDVGYAFVDAQNLHEHAGGELLRNVGFKFWREVYYHGDPDAPYKSKELDLLNKVDLTVDKAGDEVTVNSRLDDIKRRYGIESSQYKRALDLAENLELL